MKSASHKKQSFPKKAERIEARLNKEQKYRIEYAASLQGTSISDFMIGSADDAAARTIQEHEAWILSGKDREAFVDAFLNPPKPSPRMKAAARYKKRMGMSSPKMIKPQLFINAMTLSPYPVNLTACFI